MKNECDKKEYFRRMTEDERKAVSNVLSTCGYRLQGRGTVFLDIYGNKSYHICINKGPTSTLGKLLGKRLKLALEYVNPEQMLRGGEIKIFNMGLQLA